MGASGLRWTILEGRGSGTGVASTPRLSFTASRTERTKVGNGGGETGSICLIPVPLLCRTTAVEAIVRELSGSFKSTKNTPPKKQITKKKNKR